MVRRFLVLSAVTGLAVACTPAPVPHDRGCPEGVTVFASWQGEYPSPVVHVTDLVELPAYPDPCAHVPDGTCNLEPGIYHPWGAGEEFATLRAVTPYRARERFTLEDTLVEAGETIEIVGYLGENFCAFRVRDLAFNAECPFEGNYPLEELEAVPIRELQFFRAGCEGWILVDEALFENQEIERGTTIGWGKVGPATTP